MDLVAVSGSFTLVLPIIAIVVIILICIYYTRKIHKLQAENAQLKLKLASREASTRLIARFHLQFFHCKSFFHFSFENFC